MKFQSLLRLFFLLLFFNPSFGQIRFVEGILGQSGKAARQVLLEDREWLGTPASIQFKTSEFAEVQKLSLTEIDYFQIGNEAKYIKKEVDLNVSSTDTRRLESTRLPVIEKRTVLLKVLVEGSVSLLMYEDPLYFNFLVQKGNSIPELLVYKKYLINNHQISYNQTFIQQLKNSYMFPGANPEAVSYTENSLSNYFLKLNQSIDSKDITIYKREKKNVFSFSPKFGFTYSDIGLRLPEPLGGSSYVYKWPKHLEYRIGTEIEATLPFNKNKWSVILEPSLQWNPHDSLSHLFYERSGFKFLEFPVGLRYYFFLGDNSRISLTAQCSPGFGPAFGSVVKGKKVNPSANFSGAVGFNLNKITIEGKYISNTNLFALYQNSRTEYYRYVLSVSYRLVKQESRRKTK